MLFMPRNEQLSLFLGSNSTALKPCQAIIEQTLGQFSEQAKSGSISADTKDSLTQICNVLMKERTLMQYPISVFASLRKAARDLNDKSLLEALWNASQPAAKRGLFLSDVVNSSATPSPHNNEPAQKRHRSGKSAS